jgi:hypothetical protein
MNENWRFELVLKSASFSDEDIVILWLEQNVKDYEIMIRDASGICVLMANEEDINLFKLTINDKLSFMIYDYENSSFYKRNTLN